MVPQKNCPRQNIIMPQSKQYAMLLNKVIFEVNYPESNMKLKKRRNGPAENFVKPCEIPACQGQRLPLVLKIFIYSE